MVVGYVRSKFKGKFWVGVIRGSIWRVVESMGVDELV